MLKRLPSRFKLLIVIKNFRKDAGTDVSHVDRLQRAIFTAKLKPHVRPGVGL